MIKVSKYNSLIIITASFVIIITVIIMCLVSFNPFFISIAIIWLILSINAIIVTFSLADIIISDNLLILVKIFGQENINLFDFKIYNITIRRHPYFFMKTSVGNIKINYTYENFQKISELLKKTDYRKLENFEVAVKKYILPPFNS